LLKNKEKKKFIYLISPKKINNSFYSSLSKVLSSEKVSFFQLRLKNISKNKIIQIAKKIRVITIKFKVKLIINDSPKIAKLVKADGCHIGQKDTAYKITRNILKKGVVGVTCHGSKKLIDQAIKDEADYIAIGSFFKSKLKPNAKKADLKILSWAKKNIKKPVVVIGGITDKNYRKLINFGANYIAISTFIWNNPFLKPEVAIKKFI
jgi:thiamine-phosphate pyrophosphorylase